MIRPAPLLLGAVGLAVGALAVLALREATLSTHHPVDPGSRVELILDARARGGEPHQTLGEMVEAVVVACRLEVKSDPVGPVRAEGDGRFRVVLRPALDQTNRRQLRGCIEDWTLDHLRVDVVDIVTLPASSGAP